MGGMGRGPSADHPLIVAAFHNALRVEALAALLVIVAALVLWQPLARAGRRRLHVVPVIATPEPAARRVLRIGFGALWVIDGVLQAQAGMVLGLPSSLVRPAAAGSPPWVHAVVGLGLGVWTRHPIGAASSVVWIQVALGSLVLFAPRWGLSRAAGALTVPWALVVWVFGEAFGGGFGPGSSWLFGFPGPALLYAAAGGLLALPQRAWCGRRLGRSVLGAYGLAMLGVAALQAWPGRGFWRGGTAGQLPAMVIAMSGTPQPKPLSSTLAAFGHFDGAHAALVNLIVVVALAFVGVAALTGRRRVVVAGLLLGEILSGFTWVLVQDLGFLGGVGSDPNSMLPWGLLLAGGYVAWREGSATVPEPVAGTGPGGGAVARLVSLPSAAVAASLAAAGLLLVGLVPAASAAIRSGSSALPADAVSASPLRGVRTSLSLRVDLEGGRGSFGTIRRCPTNCSRSARSPSAQGSPTRR